MQMRKVQSGTSVNTSLNTTICGDLIPILVVFHQTNMRSPLNGVSTFTRPELTLVVLFTPQSLLDVLCLSLHKNPPPVIMMAAGLNFLLKANISFPHKINKHPILYMEYFIHWVRYFWPCRLPANIVNEISVITIP